MREREKDEYKLDVGCCVLVLSGVEGLEVHVVRVRTGFW